MSCMSGITVKIVTPDGTIYDAPADEVVLPTVLGQIAILPNHVPMIARLKAGEMIIKKGGEEYPMAVSTGLLEVAANSMVYIVADTAERAQDIDEARATAAHERAQTFLREAQSTDDAVFAALQAKIEKELARMSVIRRRPAGIHIQKPTHDA
jgi:F-type H+-transporting ATPase subunit epsilon